MHGHLNVKVCLQIITYLLTPRCRVLLEQLTVLQLVKKFPAFHGTRRFMTALTSVRHLSLSWASPIQFIHPHTTTWRSILLLSTHLRLGLPSGLLPSGFPTKTLYTPSPHPYSPHAQPISFFSILSPAQTITVKNYKICRNLFNFNFKTLWFFLQNVLNICVFIVPILKIIFNVIY